MPQANHLPRTGFKIMITVRDGPDVGAAFQLLPPRVTIGRGGENNIALSDPRVSRNAAIIDFEMEKITISDISGRESMMVNGQSVNDAALTDGDLIRIGETELKFIVEAMPLQTPITSMSPATSTGRRMRPQMATQEFGSPTGMASGIPDYGVVPDVGGNSRADEERNKKIRFYLIVAAVVGVALYFLTQETPSGKKETGIPTVEQIETNIKDTIQHQQSVEKRRFKSEEERTRSVEAQKHYLIGFRDFQKGQWSRAIRSFETAQAIDPQNELAGRYKRLAEKKRDEMINMMTLQGRQYREKSMWTRCSAAFEKVLDASPNKQDVKYKAAQAMKKDCDLMMDERFN